MESTNAEFVSAYDNSSISLDDRVRVSYHEEGEKGKPALVLIHGLNAHSGTWRKNISVFSRDMYVVAPSLPPWHGTPQSLDISNYVEFVHRFLKELGLQRVSIAGNSMGGWIGMRLAVDNPELVDSLILEDSAGIQNRRDDSLSEKLNDSGVPVLIIWGKDDKIIPADAGRYLHSKINESSLVILEGTGHVPHWEKPQEFNQLVSEYIRKATETKSR
jgi:pimeloyl-ACP methyl ester carboxylesterase